MINMMWQCDRCQTWLENTPRRISVEHSTFEGTVPHGWERVCGCDLCAQCATELHEWLRPNSWVKWVGL